MLINIPSPLNIGEIQTRLQKYIISISGWRAVFSTDGNEQSLSTEVGQTDVVITALFAVAAGKYFRNFNSDGKTKIAVGHDTRPTGSTLYRIIIQSLAAAGIDLYPLGCVCAPQIMSYTAANPDIDGFIYCTASHNPPGHNGFKIGGKNGAVLGEAEFKTFQKMFFSISGEKTRAVEPISAFNNVGEEKIGAALARQDDYSAVSKKAYHTLMLSVMSGSTDSFVKTSFIKTFSRCLEKNKCAILADFNGSARITSIDREILAGFAVTFHAINDRVGEFVHRIVPEGAGLDAAAAELDADPGKYLLAYVPDCDGDRGNVLFTSYSAEGGWQTIRPDAQFTFALSVLSELAFIGVFLPHRKAKTAVIANDPTSLIINDICRAFQADFFQAEVGEANVAELARQKQEEGYYVRIIGEGSNGGNITLPSTVRDPLSTIFSILKLLYLRHEESGQSLAAYAAARLGQSRLAGVSGRDFLSALLPVLSSYCATSAFEEEAILRLSDFSPAELKAAYEQNFTHEFHAKHDYFLQNFGFASYRILNYEGALVREGVGVRTGNEDGGFKILFLNNSALPAGFLWMRPSKTEPVFRLMVCVKGSRKMHDELLEWHRGLIQKSL